MRKAVLSCLIPMLVFCFAVGAIMLPYRSNIRQNAIDRELDRTSSRVDQKLYEEELHYYKIMSYCDTIAKDLQGLDPSDFKGEGSDAAGWLRYLTSQTKVDAAYIVDSNGKGIDNKGNGIDIGDLDYFSNILNNYHSGGSGAEFLRGDGYDGKAYAYVNCVMLSDDSEGFLIAIQDISELGDSLFNPKSIADYSAFVNVGGDILAEYGVNPIEAKEEDYTAWDVIPKTLNIDTLRLSIQQKSKYSTEVKDYGYLLVNPAPISSGAVLTFITYQKMENIIQFGTRNYDTLIFWIFVLSVLVTVILFVSHIVAYNSDKPSEKELSKDPATGLLTKESAEYIVKNYMKQPGIKSGLLFLFDIEGNEIKFSTSLVDKFRSSDVIGILSEKSFIVFMKDITEEKDIRNQVESLLMLVHDYKNTEDENIKVSIGAALYPKDGNSYEALIRAARKALSDSESRGRGLINFYEK